MPVEEQLAKKAMFLDENLKPVKTEEDYVPTTHQRFLFKQKVAFFLVFAMNSTHE